MSEFDGSRMIGEGMLPVEAAELTPEFMLLLVLLLLVVVFVATSPSVAGGSLVTAPAEMAALLTGAMGAWPRSSRNVTRTKSTMGVDGADDDDEESQGHSDCVRRCLRLNFEVLWAISASSDVLLLLRPLLLSPCLVVLSMAIATSTLETVSVSASIGV